jgi:hypothetical protein
MFQTDGGRKRWGRFSCSTRRFLIGEEKRGGIIVIGEEKHATREGLSDW